MGTIGTIDRQDVNHRWAGHQPTHRARLPSAGALLAAALALAATGCGTEEGSHQDGLPETLLATAAAPACPWDPGFGTKGCVQGEWWMEFSVDDTAAMTMRVEVATGPATSRAFMLGGRVVLYGGGVKFTGGTGSGPVAAGTRIRLEVTSSTATGSKVALTSWFAYLQAAPASGCAACVPTCAPGTCGSDGCGGTCGCATGAVCLADQTCCVPNTSACGPDGCGGDHGPCACTPSCGGAQCGRDGCGGTCGTCGAGTSCDGTTCVAGCVAPWSPSWQQTDSAGSWWSEFQVFGGGSLPVAVSLEILGRGTTTLGYGWGKWTGGLDGVPAGAAAILHATDATGATARTAPFRYLVDRTPQTDPCGGTPSATPACLPLSRGMVSLTMDDSLWSQAELALPVMERYGVKATVYNVSDQLQVFGGLPYAQALARAGHEVGSHTKTHPDLTTLDASALDDELRLSQQYLLANVGTKVESFASPMGSYDAAALTAQRRYYTSHRTVNPGLNYVGSSVFELKADGVYGDTKASDVCAQLAQVAASRGWSILVFHDFTSAASTSYSLTYPVADFETIVRCAVGTPGLDVVTVRQGRALLDCASP